MNPRIINLLDFEYPSILHTNESEQLLMKAVNSRKTKLVLKKTKVVLNQNTVPKPVNKTPVNKNKNKNKKQNTKNKTSTKKQTLGELGYTSKVKDSLRKDILKKAIKYFGPNDTIKKLNRLVQMHSNNNPPIASIFYNDLLYVKALQ
jgi:hypothetical protein